VADGRPIGKWLAADPAWPSLALQRASGKGPWVPAAVSGPVSSTDFLMSLPGCRSSLQLDGGVRVTLWGTLPQLSPDLDDAEESSITVQAPPTGFDADITLDRGLILLANTKEAGPARIRVRVSPDKVWQLSLADKTAEVALQRVGYAELGILDRKVPDRWEPLQVVTVFQLAGKNQLKSARRTLDLSGFAVVSWDSNAPDELEQTPLSARPEWRATRPKSAEATAMLRALRHAVGLTTPIETRIQTLLQTPEPEEFGQLAVHWCAAINDLPRLVSALANPDRGDLRGAANLELHRWMALRPGNEAELYRYLTAPGRPYSPEEARSLIQLLHPPKDEEETNPKLYDRLITNLKHPQLAVRELASELLYDLVGKAAEEIEYNPAGSYQDLDQAYGQWRKLVPSGKLPPGVEKKNPE
jgi:hypothetical protein